MAKNSINNVEGAEEIEALFKDLLKKVPEMYEEELENSANKISNSAKSKINDKTGNLKQSIKIRKFNKKDIKGVSVVAGGTKAPHAHLVEFGHRQIDKNGNVVGDVPPHPFFRNSFDEYREELEIKLKRILENIVR